MMLNKEALGALSVVLACFGYGSYIWSILKKETKPHLFTWIVWGLLTLTIFTAQRVGGAGPGSWVEGFSGLECLVIVALAVKRGEKNITLSDWAAFLCALAAIPIWMLTGDPLWAVVWATLIDTVAFYPTVRKSFLKPHEESTILYGVDIVGLGAALGAMENFTLANTLYYFTIIVINAMFLAMLLWRRKSGGGRKNAS